MNQLLAHTAERDQTRWRSQPLIVAVLAVAVLAALSTASRAAEGFLLQDELVPRSDGFVSHLRIYGPQGSPSKDESVVMLPSLGRGVEDFTEAFGSNLTTRLAQEGYEVVLIQPRGFGQSTGDITPENVTMQTLVNDIKQVLDHRGITAAHFIGHAFGNRLARSFATVHPDYVLDVTLLAAGGQVPLTWAQKQALLCSIRQADDAVRLGCIETAFFAPGHDASIWLYGWNWPVADMESSASKPNLDVDFIAAGGKPILLIQPLDDFIAPPNDAGLLIKELLGDQVTYREIENAGHALLPEQPDAVANQILDYYALRASSTAPLLDSLGVWALAASLIGFGGYRLSTMLER